MAMADLDVANTDMTIRTEPAVYVLARQQMATPELDRFLADHGVTWQTDSTIAAEVVTETAGRVCYMSFLRPRPGGNAAYLHHIKEVGHGSVLEHAVWTLLLTGVSRSLTHELVRHRAGMSYSMLSQRYVDESVAEYVEPRIIASDPELHALWMEAIASVHHAYVQLAQKLSDKLVAEQPGDTQEARTARRKAARQAARSVLPNATETKITVTANARALRHFLESRGSRHADPEIRQLACAVHAILVQESPNLFGDYVAEPLPDGTQELRTPHPKV